MLSIADPDESLASKLNIGWRGNAEGVLGVSKAVAQSIISIAHQIPRSWCAGAAAMVNFGSWQKKKVYLHGTIEHADAVMICVTYALLPLQTIKKCCPRTMYFGYHSHENAQPSQHLGFLVVHFFDFTLVVWRSRCCPWHIQWSKWWWIIGTRGTRRSKPLVVFLLSFVARDWSAHRLIQLYLSIRTLLLTH
jgi:hypothetical protein